MSFPRTSAELIKNTSTVSPTTLATVKDALDALNAASPSTILSALGDLLSYNGGPVRVAVGAADTFLGSTGAAVPSWRTAAQVLISLGIEPGTFPPQFAYETPGTSSIAYTTQEGNYFKIGSCYIVLVNLVFTPTKGTAAGDCRLTGLPATVGSRVGYGWTAEFNNQWTWAGGSTAVALRFEAGTTYGRLVGMASATNSPQFSVANTTDGTSHTIRYAGVFFT